MLYIDYLGHVAHDVLHAITLFSMYMYIYLWIVFVIDVCAAFQILTRPVRVNVRKWCVEEDGGEESVGWLYWIANTDLFFRQDILRGCFASDESRIWHLLPSRLMYRARSFPQAWKFALNSDAEDVNKLKVW